MDALPKNPTEDTVDSLNDLHISKASTALLADTPSESNPWQDKAPDSLLAIKSDEIHAPDISEVDKAIHAAPEPSPKPAREAHAEEVLHEFDPLANPEEQDAREAWARSESHPPTRNISLLQESEPSPSVPGKPEPPPKDVSVIPTIQTHPFADSNEAPKRSSGSNFPALAALARTFSIPRARPVSMDTAKNVPSPTTLSSFASQQERPHDPELSSAITRSSTPAGSGTESPRPGRERDKEPVFDFQKFLDQMKMKQTEPVAKFLRSYV